MTVNQVVVGSSPIKPVCGQMETWLLKDMGETADKQIDVAVTLRARDYKGLDNYGSNGVIEWKN